MTSWLSRSTLRIHAHEQTIWLYPAGRIDGATRDTLVYGHLTLKLAKAMVVKQVTVRLLAIATLRTPSRESSGILVDLPTIIYVSDGNKLPAGETILDYSIQLPADSTFSARPTAQSGSITYKLIATVDGAGLFGGDLQASLPLYCMQVSHQNGAMPAALDVSMQDFVEGLGIVRLLWLAPRVTASSVVAATLTIEGPAEDVTIQEASLWINENCAIQHFDKHGQLEAEATPSGTGGRFRVSHIQGSSPHTTLAVSGDEQDSLTLPLLLKKGHSLKLKHYGRLPVSILHLSRASVSGHMLRISTPPRSRSPIRTTHQLIFKLTFESSSDKTVREMVFEQPIVIASCLTLPTNVFPPEYSSDDTPPILEMPHGLLDIDWGSRESDQCVCNLTFDQCLEVFKRDSSSTEEPSVPNYKEV